MHWLSQVHSFGDSCQERLGVRRHYLSTSFSMNNWINCLLAISKNENVVVPWVLGIQWKGKVVIFQEDSALKRKLLGLLFSLSSGHVCRHISVNVRNLVERAELEKLSEHSDVALVNLLWECFQFVSVVVPVVEVKVHLLVHAFVDCKRVSGAPVRHDVSLESHSFSEVGVQGLVVFTCPDGIDEVVAAHK